MSVGFVDHGPGLACASCHVSNGQRITWQFPGQRPDCGGCHSDDFQPLAHIKVNRSVPLYYRPVELRDCAGACHIYSDVTMTSIKETRSGQHRANRGAW